MRRAGCAQVVTSLTRNTSTMPCSLAQSYRLCGRVTRQAGSSFYWSFWLLPPAKHRAMLALYAYARLTDDLVDVPAPLDAQREALFAWRKSLRLALAGVPASGVFPALVDSVRRFAIPENLLFDVIDGVEMDVVPRVYETFDDLAVYCYRVASAVGLACLPIWGAAGDFPREPAIRCGYAFQLTNILRDLKEDAARGRCYLPQDDLRRFDYRPGDLARGVADVRFRSLVKFEVERAERFYDDAARLLPHLPYSGQRVFRLMRGKYRRLLQEIQARPHEILQGRIQLTFGQKLSTAVKCLSSRDP